MICSQCGEPAPGQANFCAVCGAVLDGASTTHEDTTASIDIGELDPVHDVPDVPELAPGTGMLVVVRGPNAGSRFLLDRDQTTIGRHPDSDIFLDDVTVSRRHAEIVRVHDRLETRDLGSLNGSYVNGERVESRELHSGDELQIGRFKLLFVGASGGEEAS